MTYIEREAMREELFHIYECICHMSTCLTVEECNARKFAMEMVHDALKKIPAADVAPVKRSEWVWKDFHGDPCFLTLCCSECLETNGARETADYCPGCGAHMRKD